MSRCHDVYIYGITVDDIFIQTIKELRKEYDYSSEGIDGTHPVVKSVLLQIFGYVDDNMYLYPKNHDQTKWVVGYKHDYFPRSNFNPPVAFTRAEWHHCSEWD